VTAHGLARAGCVPAPDGLQDPVVRLQRTGRASRLAERAVPGLADRHGEAGHEVSEQGASGRAGDGLMKQPVTLLAEAARLDVGGHDVQGLAHLRDVCLGPARRRQGG
jgi:hypothetical protein